MDAAPPTGDERPSPHSIADPFARRRRLSPTFTVSTSKPLAATLATVAVLITASLPWGVISGAGDLRTTGDAGAALRASEDLLRITGVTITISGWEGYLTLAGIKLPNFLVPIAALLATAVLWARAMGVRAGLPRAIPIGLVGFGLLHGAITMFAYVVADGGSLRIGLPLCQVAFLWLAYGTFVAERSAAA